MSTLLRKFSVDSPVNPIDQKYVIQKVEVKKTVHRKVKARPIPKVTLSDQEETRLPFLSILLSPTFHWKNYLFQLPTLCLAGLSFWVASFILRNILPTTIQDILIPNFYLPLAASVFSGFFFGCWYITQNLRRSLLLAILILGVLELQLHQLAQPLWLIAVILPLLLIELLLTYRFLRR